MRSFLILAIVLLSACGPKPVVIREPAPTHVPVTLEPRTMPPSPGDTYRDKLIHRIQLEEAFLSCEIDKATAKKELE